jgi:hypothetical protein
MTQEHFQEAPRRLVRVLAAGQHEALDRWALGVHALFSPLGWFLKLVVAESVADAMEQLEKREPFDLVYLGRGVSPAAAERMAEACRMNDERPTVMVDYHSAVLVPVFTAREVPADIGSTRIVALVEDRAKRLADMQAIS